MGTATDIATPLAQKLKAEGLGTYAQAFDEGGYKNWTDLGDKEADAQAAIKQIVPDKRPGDANHILRLWREATQKQEKRAPVAIPDPLPGSQFDLTQSSITIENVTYALPTALQTTAGSKDFGAADWMVIARLTSLLYGIHMDRALESAGEESGRAKHAALVWKVPDGDDFLDPRKVGNVESTMSYTASLNNLVHNRIVGASLSIEAPFVSAAARVAREEKQAKSQVKKRLYMTGLWRYAMATLVLSECTSASPKFITAIDGALAKPAEEQFDALKQVFDGFGHVVPEKVVLGGQLYFQSERDTTGTVSEDQVKSTVSAAVSAKAAGAGATAKASFQDASGKKVEAQEIAESATFTCVGGDTTLASNPSAWAATVKDPNSWATIGRQGMTPLIDWLDDSRKRRVVSAWQSGLKRAWGGFDAPANFVLPDLGGKPFTIATCKDPKTGRGFPRKMALHLHGTGGNTKAGLVEAVDATLLADPKAHDLLFRLIFTGKVSGDGKPLYCLVSDQKGGRYVVAAQKEPGGAVGVYRPAWGLAPDNWKPTAPAGKEPPEQNIGTWTITPADPNGYLGLGDDAYMLENFATHRLLGEMIDAHMGGTQPRPGTPHYRPGLGGQVEKVKDMTLFIWVCTPYDSQ